MRRDDVHCTPLLTLLSPRRTPAVSSPTGNSDQGISIYTSVGFYPLTSKAYSKYVSTLKPDIVVALADIVYGGATPSAKRIDKMEDRSLKWIDDFIFNLENISDQAIFAPILPIDFHSQPDYLHHIADDLIDTISGLAFYSASSIADVPATTALSLLPRLSLGEPSSPHQILYEVSLGMDIFTIPFISFATDAGLALNFKFPTTTESDLDRPETHVKSLALDLSSSSFATSLTPLIGGCTCYTCTSHHAAYITHLLSAKEMLGWVLLQIHNHHTMSEFFAAIRKSIAAGTFEVDRAAFETSYESDLPEGTGQKPRARGYHFKSEGPGESKRNKPAWGNLGDGDVQDALSVEPVQPQQGETESAGILST